MPVHNDACECQRNSLDKIEIECKLPEEEIENKHFMFEGLQ